ncbi:MAG: hypothetical protein JWN85_1838 [Gammaproteobacteria bacterium]|nr:hypothetical protein [Gammaproteobacteria bacterium]
MKTLSRLESLGRRRFLRGMLNGGVVTLGLPLLNCFLNENGTAMANGASLPMRFGTWSWGLGMNSKVFVPAKVGADYELPEELAALAAVRQHVNVYTNFNAMRDSAPNLCHYSGWVILRTGSAPIGSEDRPGETIDVTISRVIGRTTRFQTVTATANGDVRTSFSYENANSINAAEASPLNFYKQLFGTDYQDPNASSFTPNPRIMARKSVLSGVLDQTKELAKMVGAEDRARLEQYYTDLRDLERQFDHQLTKPEPIAACHAVTAPTEDPRTTVDSEVVALRHRMLTDLMVMAVACDQTRVFNMAYSAAFASTIKAGYEKPHHTCTHEEPVDQALGYQPTASWFLRRSMESWAYFVEAFTKVKEGDGTLLDNVLIYATTDTAWARIHSLDGIPMFTAGRAGGRIKTGLHIDGAAGPAARLGYTAMKVMGVDTQSWGTKSNNTSKELGEILS